jgi:hypothetical protein
MRNRALWGRRYRWNPEGPALRLARGVRQTRPEMMQWEAMPVSRPLAVVAVLVAGVATACTGSTRAITQGTARVTAMPHPTTTTEPSPATNRSSTTTIPDRPPWLVARAEVVYTDPSRATPARGSQPAHAGRVLRTTVLWPTTRSGALAPGRHPLVVFAHGYATSAATYAGLLDDLVAAGFVVAAPELPGESSALPGPPVEADLVNEPCDLEFVAASIERTAPRAIAAAVVGAPLVFAGHSDGATAAAAAAYASQCAGPPPRAVVALSSDDVALSGAYRFGAPPPLLAATGTADEINPVAHTLALWNHVPTAAWLLTVDGGTHEGTFTSDPDRSRVDAVIVDFVLAEVEHDPAAAARLASAAGGRLHLRRR